MGYFEIGSAADPLDSETNKRSTNYAPGAPADLCDNTLPQPTGSWYRFITSDPTVKPQIPIAGPGCDAKLPVAASGSGGNCDPAVAAEFPITTNQCGGQSPGFLNIQQNPLFGQSTVALACFVFGNNLCNTEAAGVEVFNCGPFFVYKLVVTPAGPGSGRRLLQEQAKVCSARYCLDAEPDTAGLVNAG